ncbi:MAG: S41 family peptidase [Pseudomonadota bacterium]
MNQRHFSSRLLGALFALCCFWLSLSTAAAEGYYQQPTLAGQTLVFMAEGDLWIAPLAGGAARRLTTHEELESHPELSPDGAMVAFMATYDDGVELYVMPVAGGAPKRLTYHERVSGVAGWTAQDQILFVSGAVDGLASSTLIKAVDPDTGALETWPLADANQAAEGAQGRRYFTRYGLHRTGDHARRYRGGAMAQLWQFDRRATEAERLLPNTKANLSDPMWLADGGLYFLSDESGYFQLHSQAAGQLTSGDGWHVRHPDADGSTIVYQRGADLYRYDVASGANEKIELALLTDYDDRRLAWVREPEEYVAGVSLAPAGDRVAISARGQIAVAGIHKRRRYAIPMGNHARARQATFGHSGDWVYAIVGVDEAEQIHRFAADGSDRSERLTRAQATRLWRYAVAPDESSLAYSDHLGRLHVTQIGKLRATQIDEMPAGDDVYDLTWSADSRWLAYSKAGTGDTQQLRLYDGDTGRSVTVTSRRFLSYAPRFSKDGDWLYFLSDRHFQASPSSPWGDRNMGPMFDRRTKVYALALTRDAEFPFLAEELREPAAEAALDAKDDDEDEDNDSAEPVEIDLDSLAQRLYEVPVEPGNYRALAVGEDFLYLLDQPLQAEHAQLKSVGIDARAKLETFAASALHVETSADGTQLMYRTDTETSVVPAAAKAPDDADERARLAVNVSGWALPVDREDEWLQMFDDAWRMHRDFSFDKGMRGLDWVAVRDKYRPLVARVTHRDELSDLLGEMAGELGILHSQVRGGDFDEDEQQPSAGALGGTYEPTRGGLKITRIYQGDPDLPEERVPLAALHADIRVGDLITAVNRRPVRDRASLALALSNKADQVVELSVKRGRSAQRQVLVKPMSAARLSWVRYRDWEQTKRAAVAQASDNRVGYLHLYAMGGRDIADFAREYFAETQRDAIIFDARSNFGGNIDSWVLNELSRKAWAFWTSSTSNKAYGSVNMQRAFRGPLVMLIDARSYSDGETVAAGFKALGLGQLIGERTAGAGIWLTGRNRLTDRGVVRIAEFAQFNMAGDWLVEGEGVTPDIEVINLPHETFEGRDRQLEQAVDHLTKKLLEESVAPLEAKPIPSVDEGAAAPF